MLDFTELPLHQNLVHWPTPTACLEQSLRAPWGAVSQAVALILPQIKLNSQLSNCASFLVNTLYRRWLINWTTLNFITTFSQNTSQILKLIPKLDYICNTCNWQVCAFILNRFSHVRFFVTLWTISHKAPLSMEFSRQEYWSGLPFPPARESSRSRYWTRIFYASCIGRRVLYHQCHQGSPADKVEYQSI